MLGVAPITYAKHGEVCIAYRMFGDGPVDLLMVPGFISHLDLQWSLPEIAAMYRRLGSFSRFITFDKPGTGQSWPSASPTCSSTPDAPGTSVVVSDAAERQPAANDSGRDFT